MFSISPLSSFISRHYLTVHWCSGAQTSSSGPRVPMESPFLFLSCDHLNPWIVWLQLDWQLGLNKSPELSRTYFRPSGVLIISQRAGRWTQWTQEICNSGGLMIFKRKSYFYNSVRAIINSTVLKCIDIYIVPVSPVITPGLQCLLYGPRSELRREDQDIRRI